MGIDLDAPLNTFLNDVASKRPTPGGGSVAALAGALAAGLTSMVCRLTLGKKGYEEVQEETERLLGESESLRERLQELIGEDAEAYDEVTKAFRMEKSTPEAKEARARAIQQTMKGAARVPMETAERCRDLLAVVKLVSERGNVNALSDAGVAAHLSIAGFHSARLNVEVNLPSIKDEAFVNKMRKGLEKVEWEAIQTHADVLLTLEKRL